jgi:hypothetical protein
MGPMSEEKQQPTKPSEPAAAGPGEGTASPAYIKLEPAHGQSDASLTLTVVKKASGRSPARSNRPQAPSRRESESSAMSPDAPRPDGGSGSPSETYRAGSREQ